MKYRAPCRWPRRRPAAGRLIVEASMCPPKELCEDVIVMGSGAPEKMTWLDAYGDRAPEGRLLAKAKLAERIRRGCVAPGAVCCSGEGSWPEGRPLDVADFSGPPIRHDLSFRACTLGFPWIGDLCERLGWLTYHHAATACPGAQCAIGRGRRAVTILRH